MTNVEILARLKKILEDAFEINPARVTENSHLFTELDLDSIDTVDLAIRLQEITGKRIKAEEFKNVRTVGDVVTTVQGLLAA